MNYYVYILRSQKDGKMSKIAWRRLIDARIHEVASLGVANRCRWIVERKVGHKAHPYY